MQIKYPSRILTTHTNRIPQLQSQNQINQAPFQVVYDP